VAAAPGVCFHAGGVAGGHRNHRHSDCALLLPAVQAAARSGSPHPVSNNLKQIGLSFQTYYGIKKHFPTAGVGGQAIYHYSSASNGMDAAAGVDVLGWSFQILPYSEEAAIYRSAMNAANPWAVIPDLGDFLLTQRNPNVAVSDAGRPRV